MTRTPHQRVRLALLWLAILAVAALLGKAAGIGPLAWFETWLAVTTGRLLAGDLIFLLMVLALPSLWVLLGAAARAAPVAPSRPRPRRNLRISAAILFVLAALGLTVALGAGLGALTAPDGSAPAAPATAEGLAEAAAAGRRVAIGGIEIGAARAGFLQPARSNPTTWTYTGFRPDPRPAGRPLLLFVERRGGRTVSPADGMRPGHETIEGYLVENGLPPYARIALARSGVTIAAPHYLLRNGDAGLRGTYFAVMVLSLFFALAFGASAAGIAMKAARLPPDP